MRRSRSAWCAMVSRSARAAASDPTAFAQLRCEGPDARQRRLQVMRHAAQEVGLELCHAVQLIGLRAQARVEQRMLDGGRRVLAQEAQQPELRRRWRWPALPGCHQDRAQIFAGRDVHHDERPPRTRWRVALHGSQRCRAAGRWRPIGAPRPPEPWRRRARSRTRRAEGRGRPARAARPGPRSGRRSAFAPRRPSMRRPLRARRRSARWRPSPPASAIWRFAHRGSPPAGAGPRSAPVPDASSPQCPVRPAPAWSGLRPP